MKSELTVILCWCCIWLCQEVLAINILNNTTSFPHKVRRSETDPDYNDDDHDVPMEPDDDDDDKDTIDYSGFLVKIKVGGTEYTGTLIDPKIVVADPKTKTEETEVCSFKGKECKAPEEITIVDDIAFLKLSTYILEPMVIERDVLGETCKAIGLSHSEPVDAQVNKAEILCTKCKDFDAIICGSRLAGITMGDPNFKLIGPKQLRDKAGATKDQDYEDDMNEMADEAGSDIDNSTEKEEWLSMRKTSEAFSTLPNAIFFLVLIIGCLIFTAYNNEVYVGA